MRPSRAETLFAQNFANKVNHVLRAEFLQQVCPVEVDRPRADAEGLCSLLAGGSANDLSERGFFPGSQSLMAERISTERLARGLVA